MQREPEQAHRIRPASDDDLDRLVDLAWEVAAEGRWLGAEVPFDRAARRRRYAETLTPPASTILVADAGGSGNQGVIGEITVSVAPYGVADISMMLAEGWRNRGLGRALLGAATTWARDAGAHKLWLEVWPDNAPAIALYRRAGFIEEGRKVRHYRRRNGELLDAILMGRPIDTGTDPRLP